MQSLTENKIEIDEDSGKPVIAEGGHKKVKGFGVVDFPHDAIKSAIQAGIKICTATISYSLADRSQAKVLQLCRAYGVRVFAKGGLMAGLISERYVGAPCPDPVAADPDLDSVPAALDAVKSYGGWDRVQGLLAAVKAVADKHGVKMQTVALRWQMDQGTTPVANMRWTPKCWKQFGYLHWTEKRPGVDAALFADNSFLDAEDMAKLNALA